MWSKKIYAEIGGIRPLGSGGRNAWGGNDFAFRACQKGFASRRCSEAVAYHDDYAINDLNIYCERMRKVSKLAVLHFQRCPELLKRPPMFVDKTPVKIGRDSLPLMARKIIRAFTSTSIGVKILITVDMIFGKLNAPDTLRFPIFCWLIGANIFRGYREGLTQFGKTRNLTIICERRTKHLMRIKILFLISFDKVIIAKASVDRQFYG